MKEEKCYAGNLAIEIEEISNMDDKSDETVRISFSSLCGPLLSIVCC